MYSLLNNRFPMVGLSADYFCRAWEVERNLENGDLMVYENEEELGSFEVVQGGSVLFSGTEQEVTSFLKEDGGIL